MKFLPVVASLAVTASAYAVTEVCTEVVTVYVTVPAYSAAPSSSAPASYSAPAPAPAPSAPAPAPAPPAYSAPPPPPPPPPAPTTSAPASYSAPKPAPPPASSSYVAQPAPPKSQEDKPSSPVTIQQSDSILSRMSLDQVNGIFKTCWGGKLVWPLPNTPNPCIDVPSPQLSLYAPPAAKPNTLTINNYCPYDIHFKHYNNEHVMETGTLTAKTNIDRPLSGTVFKASKYADMGKDTLIEYGVGPDGNVFYDLSLITCIENGSTTDCAGHEAGLQLGNTQGKTFQCAAGAWCDDQVYMYEENLCKKQNPVSACPSQHGLTMDFCASMKH